jgi:hypothetical protein
VSWWSFVIAPQIITVGSVTVALEADRHDDFPCLPHLHVSRIDLCRLTLHGGCAERYARIQVYVLQITVLLSGLYPQKQFDIRFAIVHGCMIPRRSAGFSLDVLL